MAQALVRAQEYFKKADEAAKNLNLGEYQRYVNRAKAEVEKATDLSSKL